MKDFLFGILVIILMPVYFIRLVIKKIIEDSLIIGEPFVEGIKNIFENMYNFWKRILNKERKEKKKNE